MAGFFFQTRYTLVENDTDRVTAILSTKTLSVRAAFSVTARMADIPREVADGNRMTVQTERPGRGCDSILQYAFLPQVT